MAHRCRPLITPVINTSALALLSRGSLELATSVVLAQPKALVNLSSNSVNVLSFLVLV